MTSIFATVDEPELAGVVTVALVGPSAPSVPTLGAALSALPASETARWNLIPADAIDPGTRVDIVVCDGPAAVRASAVRWPGAQTLALMPSGRDEQGVLFALEAGAHVCGRESDSTLVAAYLHSIARRRGLLSGTAAR